MIIVEDQKDHLISTDAIFEAIDKFSEEIALIWISAVNFYTGQVQDIKSIATYAHKSGMLVGVDLAHAIGNVPLLLHEWEIDFGAWCSYKYLNGGPGATGGLYVHSMHHKKLADCLKGWWGNRLETRFLMSEGLK